MLQILAGTLAAKLTQYPPFCVLSDDGSKVLVIQGWDRGWGRMALEQDGDPYEWCPKEIREVPLGPSGTVDLLRDFPSSGVYTLPDRTQVYPLHAVCLEENLLASPDLSPLALLNHTGETEALVFLENGKVIRTYKIKDLLLAFSDYKYRRLVTGGWYYPWHDDFRRVGRDSVELTTTKRTFWNVPLGYYEKHRFDLKSARLHHTEVFYGNVMAVPTIGALLVGFGIFAGARRARLSRHRRADSEMRKPT